MSIINIQPVQREGARLFIVLGGVSGGGKTFTAIQLALGLANHNPDKIGFLDTESGRGKLYADSVPSPYKYGELRPPFSPDRYVGAIDQFAKAGVEVLIIDSGSHEWEGTGGCQDIAEAGNPRLPNWNKAKSEHKKFMSCCLSQPMHIILCLRAREKAKPEEQIVDGKKKTVYVDMGLQMITEKNVVFEATISLMLHDQGTRQDVIKCPDQLKHILGRGNDYITAEDGADLRAWVDGAKQLVPSVERHRKLVQAACEKGSAALKAQWESTPATTRKKLGAAFLDQCKASAKAFDDMAAGQKNTTVAHGNALDTLNAVAGQVAAEETPDEAPAAAVRIGDAQAPAAHPDNGNPF